MFYAVIYVFVLIVEGVRHIEVLGRTLKFEKTCGHILDVTFPELCCRVSDVYMRLVL